MYHPSARLSLVTALSVLDEHDHLEPGGTTTVVCEVTGVPIPTLQWTVNGVVATDELENVGDF